MNLWFHDSLMITGFVSAMMLIIEYLHVWTGGRWQKTMIRQRFGQYLLAAGLGVTPGCLGAFTVVTMFSHGAVSLGAVVAAMIATSGDESFVMLAMIPRQAIVLAAVMFAVAVGVGVAVDLLAGERRGLAGSCSQLVFHAGGACECYPRGKILAQWRDCSAVRGVLLVSLALFAAAVAVGEIGPSGWNWIRVSLLAVCAASIFIVATVSDHFLDEHLWRHVFRRHAPRVFLWTFAALAASGPIERFLAVTPQGQENTWVLLGLACLIGVIPESGPHLIFVTLYAQHVVPFGVLLANSIVQDGHGMLPMLADSRRGFLTVKAVNVLVGAIAGAVALGFGL